MTANGILQIALFAGLILLLVKPLGTYMARVFSGERTFLSRPIEPIERFIYRLLGVDPAREQHWTSYTVAMLVFSVLSVLFLFLLQRLQGVLPLNPQGLAAPSPDLAFNTAISFVTNTNWQSYAGESTMSYLTQMAGLGVQNFLSASVGIALAVALIRGFARHSTETIGNFWVDLTRATLYLLLPICLIYSLVLVWQGVPQNFDTYTSVKTLEGATQTLPQGPIASQEAIKMLGTNGGGFLNANSAHPYENPTPLTNLLQMVSIFAIGAGLTYTFGRMVGNTRQGWTILAAMGTLWLGGVALTYSAESTAPPLYDKAGVSTLAAADQAGGNMEGKEVRFGIASTALFAVVTTDASCGAVNGMHDSFTPLGGLVTLFNIELGEVVIGGVGSGLYGMLLFAIVSVFIAGLMVGRTPEYLGKKIEAKEMKMAVLAIILILPLSILGFTALSSVHPEGIKGVQDAGPHGFTEMLYAYTSATGNNGSAFGGLSANTPFYNTTLGLAMLIGRFLFIIPAMAVAGSLARKKTVPPSSGTFPTTGTIWVLLLVAVVLIVGGLTFFPALALGPIVEHLVMGAGGVF